MIDRARGTAQSIASPLGRVLDAAPVSVALIDLDRAGGPAFEAVNPAFAELMGYRPDELAGLPVQAVSNPDDVARTGRVLERVRRGELEGFELEKRYVRRDGSAFWGLAKGALLDGDRAKLVAHVSDTTDRRRVERELVRRRRELEESQRHADVASFELCFDPPQVRYSAQMYRMAGWAPGTPPPTFEEYVALVHPDDRRILTAASERWDRPHVLEYRLVRSDGRVLLLQAMAAPILDPGSRREGVAGTVRDITRERALEVALDESERVASAVELSPVAHLLVATDSGVRVAYANDAAAQLLGRRADELVDLPLSELTRDRALLHELGGAGRDGCRELLITMLTADGQEREVSAHVKAVPGGTAASAFVLLVIRDAADHAPPPAPEPERMLSKREREILDLVADGSGTEEIARTLWIAPETVKTHLSRIFHKLGVRSRAAAVAAALRAGELQ